MLGLSEMPPKIVEQRVGSRRNVVDHASDDSPPTLALGGFARRSADFLSSQGTLKSRLNFARRQSRAKSLTGRVINLGHRRLGIDQRADSVEQDPAGSHLMEHAILDD